MRRVLLRLMQDTSFRTIQQRDCERIIDELTLYKEKGDHVTLSMEYLTGGNSCGSLMLANVITEFGYDTHAFSDCFSAACLIFAGGNIRTASTTARFMLHEASIDRVRDDLQTEVSYQRFRQDFGWDERTIHKFFGKKEEYFWTDEAIQLGLVNHVGHKQYDTMVKFRY
jgi:hypothetical protein